MWKLCTLLLLGCLVADAAASITCMDQNGQPVDWFAFYKLPRMSYNPNPHIQNGTGFLYLDSNNKSWRLAEMGMETGNHAIYYTLQQYYNGNANQFSIMYNDEYPNSTIWSDISGHTKGVSQFDSESGYWLIHSIPKFPSNVSYEFPSNAHWYGQMGICVSFPYLALGDIATQLFYNRPFTYQMTLPLPMAVDFPTLIKVQQGKYQEAEPFTSTKSMVSSGGQKFTHFAKAGAFNRDLYFDLVAPSLYTSLKVETWQHGNSSSNLFSWCTPSRATDVLNARDIGLPYGIRFSNYEDHSKFAVAFNENFGGPILPWVCIGDINRQVHQMVRGGGTMCIQDYNLHATFANIVAETYPCHGDHH